MLIEASWGNRSPLLDREEILFKLLSARYINTINIFD